MSCEFPAAHPLHADLRSNAIDADGCDTAPMSALTADRTAVVSVVWSGFSVAALSTTATDSVTYRVQLSGSPTTVRIDLAAGGSVLLGSAGGGLWLAGLSAAQALAGYTGAKVNHNFVGYLRVFEGTTQALQLNVFINVIDGSVPPVTPTVVSGSLQYSCHVANVWRPSLTLPPPVSVDQGAVADAIGALGDQFDFFNVVYSLPSYPSNRNHRGVKNTVTGIGLATFDQTASWGSVGRLLGVSQYPIDTFFDLAETGSLHELGHQWVNFSSYALLSPGIPHWRPGTQARGIMGVSLAGGVGGAFPYDLVPLGGGIYQMVAAPRLRDYTDLDLYYMGFLPPDSVGSNFVFTDPNITTCHGCSGPVTFFSVGDVIAAQGPRVPDASSAPHFFHIGTVVVSRDRLLTAEELAMFDYFAARGEATAPVPFTIGLDSGVTNPFRVATRGIGTLATWMSGACAPVAVEGDQPPTAVRLRIAGANPATGPLALEWTQSAAADVVLEVFAVNGARVARLAHQRFEAGTHGARWLAGAAPAGVYFASLSIDGRRVAVRRTVVAH